MTATPHEQQPREPGVRYRQETRWRTVTTVIDGCRRPTKSPTSSTCRSPKDWETLVERGLFVWAVVLVAVAFVGTCASLGGLFSELLHPAWPTRWAWCSPGPGSAAWAWSGWTAVSTPPA
ncbi:hypothetical protein ACR6C2_08355 [Streptomyces sp. INA 01156]